MRADVIPSHDTTSLYLRWEIVFEGRERERLATMSGPLWLEVDTSNYLDPASGKRLETTRVRIPIWPHPGERNLGQGRWWDVDSRRRFWVNLQDAIGTQVVDFVFDKDLRKVPKEGVTISVPERPGAPAPAPAPGPTPAPASATT